jgi:integration host factor subunit beta
MKGILTKKELATMLWSADRFTGISQKTMVDLVETLTDLIVCHFQSGGERVVLRGFGVFKLRRRCAFTGSDPRTGKSMEIPEKLSVIFKPSAEVIRRLNLK